MRPSEVMNSEQERVRGFFDLLEHPRRAERPISPVRRKVDGRGSQPQSLCSAIRIIICRRHAIPPRTLEPRTSP